MNRQVFTVGIYLPPDTSKVSELRLAESIQKGYKEHFGQELINLFVMENNVEQNVERPKNQQKMLDLLRSASDSLNSYRAELDGDYNDSLAMEIQDFLDGKQ